MRSILAQNQIKTNKAFFLGCWLFRNFIFKPVQWSFTHSKLKEERHSACNCIDMKSYPQHLTWEVFLIIFLTHTFLFGNYLGLIREVQELHVLLLGKKKISSWQLIGEFLLAGTLFKREFNKLTIRSQLRLVLRFPA